MNPTIESVAVLVALNRAGKQKRRGAGEGSGPGLQSGNEHRLSLLRKVARLIRGGNLTLGDCGLAILNMREPRRS
jgi:hypothetical protein